jgi:hypothetical protein
MAIFNINDHARALAACAVGTAINAPQAPAVRVQSETQVEHHNIGAKLYYELSKELSAILSKSGYSPKEPEYGIIIKRETSLRYLSFAKWYKRDTALSHLKKMIADSVELISTDLNLFDFIQEDEFASSLTTINYMDVYSNRRELQISQENYERIRGLHSARNFVTAQVYDLFLIYDDLKELFKADCNFNYM